MPLFAIVHRLIPQQSTNLSAAFCFLVIYLLHLQSAYCEGDLIAGESAQADRRLQESTRGRGLNCKQSAFKLETLISEFKGDVNCTSVCAKNFRDLQKYIGKGSSSNARRPVLGFPVSPSKNLNPQAPYLDDCMYHNYYCLTQLTTDQLSDPELIDDPFFQSMRLSAASRRLQGYTACHCGLTLKLWRVFRSDITLKGAPESTNCSNVEICKRLSGMFSRSPGWPCVAETSIRKLVPCLVKGTGNEVTRVCACNVGVLAEHPSNACQPIDWSRKVQQDQGDASSDFAVNAAADRQERTSSFITTFANQEDGNVWSLQRQLARMNDYQRLQLRMWNSPEATAEQFTSLQRYQDNSIAPFTQPITELLPAAHLSAQDFTPVAIDYSDSFANVEALSGLNEAVELASVENNGKHPREDTISELEGHLNLDELVAKRNRWERGESSRSAHDRSTPSSFTHGRGEQEHSYVNRYSTPSSLLHLIPAAFTGTQENVQQGSQSSHTSSQGIQLEGSWSDILHQLGPEPMPDLASLGNSQLNAASSFENNAEQPDFEDLEFRDDPPLFDENDVDDFFL